MARTAEQIQADIDTIMGSLSAPAQVRFPDGSSVTNGDPAHNQARLDLLRAELAGVQGMPARTRIRFIGTSVRRW